MRFGRFRMLRDPGRTFYAFEKAPGILEELDVSGLFRDTPTGPCFTGRTVSAEDTACLAPSCPSKIVAVGLNYRDHAAELGLKEPGEPVLFLKPPSSVLDPGQSIRCPAGAGRIDYEAELALIIRNKCRHVKREHALDHVLGFTCLNDVTARDLQAKDGQWTRAKSFDTFSPFGPWIVPPAEVPFGDTRVRCFLNGDVKQDSRTSRLFFPVETIVEFVSGVMTLLPGDVITTGTPPGIGPMSPGDTVEIRIDGIGSLINPVSG